MITIQARVHCDDESGCQQAVNCSFQLRQGEVRISQDETIELAQFELVRDRVTTGWHISHKGEKCMCPQHYREFLASFRRTLPPIHVAAVEFASDQPPIKVPLVRRVTRAWVG